MISKTWLNRQDPDVIKNVEVENHKQTVYHVSQNPAIKVFKPMISLSAANSENRTIPRINVGISVCLAMFGYTRVSSANLYGASAMESGRANKDPVMTIYAKEVSGVLVPNKKLVFDAEVTGERWIVGDKPENMALKFDNVGEFFVTSTVRSSGIESGSDSTTLLMSVRRGCEVLLDKDMLLKTGFYRCIIPTLFYKGAKVMFTYEPITAKEYKQMRAAATERFKGMQ